MTLTLEPIHLHIGDNVDRLCALEIRPPSNSLGVIWKLHQAARAKVGLPTTLAAAKLLVENVSAGDVVVIATGAGVPDFLPAGETDGPMGAASLAAALAHGLGAIPVFITHADYVENVAATALAAGLGRRTLEVARKVPKSCAVLAFPGDDSAEAAARDLLDRCQPKVLVAIENLGPNAKGVAHTSTGWPADPTRARAEHVFREGRRRKIPSIGVGDNGNEIGCGLVLEAVHQHREWAKVCRCPCGGGSATVEATDVLVVAGTSNWGAYGITACLAALLKRPELIQSQRTEERMLEYCIQTLAIDGSTGLHAPGVDGTPPEVQVGLVNVLRAIVTVGLLPPRKRPY
jgi:hypothetical protein